MNAETIPETNDAAAPRAYATPELALAWTSPEPLQFDYTHPDTGQLFRIEGICRAADKSKVVAEIRRLTPTAAKLRTALGYEPAESDIIDACWAAACVAAPKMTPLQWLRFGREASLGAVFTETWIACRIIERRDPDAPDAEIPDGVEAAKAEMKADPLVGAGGPTASAT